MILKFQNKLSDFLFPELLFWFSKFRNVTSVFWYVQCHSHSSVFLSCDCNPQHTQCPPHHPGQQNVLNSQELPYLCPVTLTIRQIVPPNICPAGRGVMTSPCHVLMIPLLFTLAFGLLGYLSFSLQLDRLIVFQLGYLLETGVYFIQCEQVKFFNVMPCLQWGWMNPRKS